MRNQYARGVALVAGVTLFCHTTVGLISEDNLMLLYLLSIIVAALYWGEGPAVLVALLSVVALGLGVFNPSFQFSPSIQYLLSLIFFLTVAYLISALSNRLRRQARQAQRREMHTAALYAFSQAQSRASDKKSIARAFVNHLSQAYGYDVRVFLEESPVNVPAGEREVLQQVLRSGKEAGRHTEAFDYLDATYYPLATPRAVVGAVRLAPQPGHSPLDAKSGNDQETSAYQLLRSFCSQAALALEQVDTAEQAQQAAILAQTEKLQTALLNSISHDLHTPLASILGSLQVVRDPALSLDSETREGLLTLAVEQTERLRRLVGNLLEMTRLDGPGLRLDRQAVDVEELLGALMSQLPAKLRTSITVSMERDLPEIEVDYVLTLTVLQNLVENARKYSAPDTGIEVRVERVASGDLREMVQFSVLDRGQGVPTGDLERIFERFYRLERDRKASGAGLGLSICRGIVDAHDGKIWAEHREGGGTTFCVHLPTALPDSSSGGLGSPPSKADAAPQARKESPSAQFAS